MITKLRYGNTNTFLITGDSGTLLVDTDYAGTMPAFYKAIKSIGIKVSDITYVLATHYHPDHMGLISELMEQGVQLLVMETQKDAIHDSDRIFAKDPSLGYRPIDGDQAQILSFEDSRAFLAKLGIAGCIIPLKSHSADSIAVLLDDGTFLVGDLEPLRISKHTKTIGLCGQTGILCCGCIPGASCTHMQTRKIFPHSKSSLPCENRRQGTVPKTGDGSLSWS